jgi:uncharacterized membrane protein
MEATAMLAATNANNAALRRAEQSRWRGSVSIRWILARCDHDFDDLDHARDFLGVTGVNPTDPAQTTIPLFFARWITHFCAPVFFLLTGTGAYLSLRRQSKRGLSQFLFTRGLWLILLELTLVRCFGFQFNLDYHVTFLNVLNVLWALGWAMVVQHNLTSMKASKLITALMVHRLLDGSQT